MMHGSLFGYLPGDELNFENFRSAIHPDDREAVLQEIEKSLETGADFRPNTVSRCPTDACDGWKAMVALSMGATANRRECGE